MSDRIPGMGFLSAYFRPLTFQSRTGFANVHTRVYGLNFPKLITKVVSGPKVFEKLRWLASVYFLRDIMSRKVTDSGIEHSEIRVLEIRKVGGDPHKPEYGGIIETPHYEQIPFTTDLDCLEENEEYEAVYEFTEGWRGETVAEVRLIYTGKIELK